MSIILKAILSRASMNPTLILGAILILLSLPSGSMGQSGQAADLYKQASKQYESGDVGKSITLLEKAVEAKSDYVEAWIMLGNARLEMGEFQQAAKAFGRASEIKPGDYAILNSHLNALENSDDKSAQLPVLKKLYALNKNDLVIRIKYLSALEAGDLNANRGDYIALLEDLRFASASNLDYDSKLAGAYLRAGEREKAAKIYRELLEVQDESWEHWAGLAEALEKTDAQGAKDAYEKAALFTNSAPERAKFQKRAAELKTTEPPKQSGTVAVTPAPSETIPDPAVAIAAKAEADGKAKAEADAKSKMDVEAKAKADAEAKAKTDAEAKSKMDAEAKAKAEAEAKAKMEAEAKSIVDAEAKAKADAEAKAKMAAEVKAKAEVEAKAKAEADAKAKTDAEAKAKAEAEAKSKMDAEAKAKAEAEAKAKMEAEAKSKAEAEAKAKMEAEAKSIADAEAEAKAKTEADAKTKAEAEAKAKMDAEAKVKAEADAKAKMAAEVKAKAEADAKAKADADAKSKMDAEAKAKAEAEAKAKAEAEAKAKAEADARAKAEADARAKVEAEAKAKAEAAARAEAERMVKEERERQAKVRADSIAQAERDRRAKITADSIARVEAAKLEREEAERKAKARADSLAVLEAERKAKAEAEAKAKAEADARAKVEAEAKAKAEAAVRAEAERIAKEERELKAKVRADSIAQAERDRRAKITADSIARVEAAKLAREEAERRAKARTDSLEAIEADRRAKAEAEREFQRRISAVIAGTQADIDTSAFLEEVLSRQKKDSGDRLREAEGVIYFRKGDFGRAASVLQKLPSHSLASSRMLALSLYETNQFDKAVPAFKKVPNLADNRSDWDKYIRSLIEAKQRSAAAQEYERYLIKHSDSEEALEFLIAFFRNPLQKEKLIPRLEMKLAKTPKDADLLKELSDLLGPQNPKGLEYHARYVAVNPGDEGARLELARNYEKSGRTADAAKIFEELAPSRKGDKAYNMHLAGLFERLGQAPLALKYHEIALESDGRDRALILKLAAAYDAKGDVAKATEAYGRAFELDGKDVAVRTKLISLLQKQGKKSELRDVLITTERANPKAHDVQFLLSKDYLAAGDRNNAYDYLAKAISNAPGNSEYEALLPAVIVSEDQVIRHLDLLEKLARKPDASAELLVMVARGHGERNPGKAAGYFAEAHAKKPALLAGKREPIIALHAAKNHRLAGDLAEIYLQKNDGNDREILRIQVESYKQINAPLPKLKAALVAQNKLDGSDLTVLEDLATVYQKEKNTKAYLETLERIVRLDPGHKDFLLRLAREKDQGGDKAGALSLYEQWAVRHPDDEAGLKAYHNLARAQKDVTRQRDALEMLVKRKGSDPRYAIELAELNFAQNGDLGGIERQVKADPTWEKGRLILVREYVKQKDLQKLLPLEMDLAGLAQKDAQYLEPLADVYALKKNSSQANDAYFELLKRNPKSRPLFDKVYRYSKENNSRHLGAILALGVNSFGEDAQLKREYAGSLGKTPKALEIYEQLLASDPDKALLKTALDLAQELKDAAASARLLDNWVKEEPRDAKAWEQMVEVQTRLKNETRVREALAVLTEMYPDRKDLALRLGDLQERNKQPDQAALTYRRSLNAHPKDKELQNKYLQAVRSLNKKDEYREALVQVESNDATAHNAQFQLARLYLGEKDKERAYAFLTKALSNEPNNSSYLDLLPLVVETDGQIERHFPQLEAMARKPDAKPELLALVARGYSLKKNPTAAADYYTQAHRKNPTLVEKQKQPVLDMYAARAFPLSAVLAEKYLAGVDSRDGEIWEILVKATEETDKTGQQLRAVLTRFAVADPERAQKYMMKLAELDLAQKDTSAAITHARRFLQGNPESVAGYRFLLPLVAASNDPNGHAEVLGQLARLDKSNAGRYSLDLGLLEYRRKNYAAARTHLLEAAKTQGSNPRLWYALGVSDNQTKEPGLGVEKFRKAYELEPENETYVRAYAQSLKEPSELKDNLKVFQFLSGKNPSVAERLKLAQSLHLNGQFAAAAREWDWLVQADPTLPERMPMLAESYLKAGQPAKARVLFEKQLEKDPGNLDLMELLLGIYVQEKNAAGYRAMLERIVRGDPERKDYQLSLAREKEKAGDPVSALDLYGRWVSRNRDDRAALESMHKIAEARKDTAQLINALEMLVGIKGVPDTYAFQLAEVDYARTGDIERIEKLVRANPGYTKGRLILVNVHYSKRTMTRLVPFEDFLAKEAPARPELLAPLADLYAFLKKTRQANDAYFSLLKANVKNRGIFEKVYGYSLENNSPHLTEILKLGASNHPGDLEIKFAYAGRLGQTAEALKLYQEIVTADRNHLEAVKRGAPIAVKLGQRDAAINLYQRWAGLEPDSKEAWTQLALLYEQSKDHAKLGSAYERLFQLSPKSDDLAYKSSMAYRAAKQNEKALDLVLQASQLKPANIEYQRDLGLLLMATGKTTLAKEPLIQVSKSREHARNPEVLEALYRIYTSENDKPNAYMHLSALNKVQPRNKAYAFTAAALAQELDKPADVVSILEHPALRDSLNADMSFLLMGAYLKAGQKTKAQQLAPVLANRFPTEAKTSLPLAMVFFEMGDKAKAKPILMSLVKTSPSLDAYYYLGLIRYDEKNWKEAIANLEKADKGKPEVLEPLGRAYSAAGEPKRAAAVLETLYSLTKKEGLLKDLYSLYKQSGDRAGALRTLERLVIAFPKEVEYLYDLAVVHEAGGDMVRAEPLYEQIVKLDRKHAGASMSLGLSYAQRGDFAKALSLLEVGVAGIQLDAIAWKYLGQAYAEAKRHRDALGAFQKAFTLNPNDLEVAVGKMQAASALKADKELHDAYADVVQLDSNNLGAVSGLVEIRYAEKKFGEAAALYGRLVMAGQTTDKQVWANFGYSLLEIKRLPEAKRALQAAVDLGETDPKLMTSLARLYKEEGDTDKAESVLQGMVDKNPRNHLAYFWLGQIAIDRQQEGVAEDYFKKAMRLEPENPDYVESLAAMYFVKEDFLQSADLLRPIRAKLSSKGRIMYGDCLFHRGQIDQAMSEYGEAYKSDPSPVVLARLADAHIRKEKPREALKLVEASKFKDDVQVRFAAAKAWVALRENDKARAELESLLRLNKHFAPYYFNLGMTYYNQSDLKKASREFGRALKYDADYMDAVFYTGMSLLRTNKPADSRNYFNELSQDNRPSWRAKGFYGLGISFAAEGKPEAAENFLKKSIEVVETPEALAALARAYLRMGKLPEADQTIRQAQKLDATAPLTLAAAADVLLAQERKNEAMRIVRSGLTDNPHSCDLLIASAKTNLAMGNFEASRSNSNFALTICPENPMPHYFIGLVSEKKYDKKQAKSSFRTFRKQGGEVEMIPAEYR